MSRKTLKIAHLTSAHPRNDVRINVKMCSSIVKADFDVSLIVADGKPDEEVSGLKIYNSVKNKNSRLGRIFKSSKAVYKKALELDCDVYHLHDPELLPYALKLKKKGKKVIFDAHEDFPKQLLSKPYLNKFSAFLLSNTARAYENYVCKRLDCVIGATPLITEKFGQYVRAVNINNYPILGELCVESAQPNNNREIIYLGGISKIRGVKEVVESLQYIDDVTLNLVGNISSEAFKQELKELEGWAKVKEHGLVNRERAAEILSQSKVGIVTFLPVPNHVDSQPNKMFEYMSARLPIVTSNFPLWRDIVEKNNCGICIDPTEPKSIAKAVEQLLNNTSQREECGANGQDAVNTKFNWDIEKEKLIELYKTI